MFINVYKFLYNISDSNPYSSEELEKGHRIGVVFVWHYICFTLEPRLQSKPLYQTAAYPIMCPFSIVTFNFSMGLNIIPVAPYMDCVTHK